MKEEEPPRTPDEYELFEFRRDQTVSDIRISTTRSVDFKIPLKDPVATDENGDPFIIQNPFYSVSGRTLAWVAKNDEYFLYNNIKYDPTFLEQFGMDNNWIEHESLFVPSTEKDAWQYNQNP